MSNYTRMQHFLLENWKSLLLAHVIRINRIILTLKNRLRFYLRVVMSTTTIES